MIFNLWLTNVFVNNDLCRFIICCAVNKLLAGFIFTAFLVAEGMYDKTLVK